ncbi:aldose 1-epimerase [Flagellimonas algicola]|uniref:Aldose 1-epimerase n=1 Tax=Flagellimonas algicola TaxID=2583815 RepID=A0ABY2WRY5_9FLAO|nr:aldose 1-epimerase [Allomuricauda algicola]TMU57505.1 aldose 1-epimerase [Allomuricauda algicola]
MIALQQGNTSVTIEAGELVCLKNQGHEFIHQKGSPGWRSSDTEMFPIIGPVNEADFRVQVPKGNAIQDQHGLLRELDYFLESNTETTASFVKHYKADTPVKNSKFPEKSSEEWLVWPYDFRFEKTFQLSGNQLEIGFKISGEENMPFMLGYHPAFKLHTEKPLIIAGQGEIQLDDVLEVGSRAFQVQDTTSILLRDKRDITISTEGFGHFMCWTEVRNMICIEPISFYPYTVAQDQLHQGFQQLKGEVAVFKVVLSV